MVGAGSPAVAGSGRRYERQPTVAVFDNHGEVEQSGAGMASAGFSCGWLGGFSAQPAEQSERDICFQKFVLNGT